MKKYLLILICLTLLGCKETKNPEGQEELACYEQIKTVTVDGCEYVLFCGGHGGGIVHKENCKNLEHKK